jgi:hypothetical protein
MIETKNKQLNIKDLAIGTPKKEQKVKDPVLGFGEREWAMVRTLLQITPIDLGSDSNGLLATHILDNSQLESVEFYAEELERKDIEAAREKEKLKTNDLNTWNDFIEKARDLKLAYPEGFQNLKLDDEFYNKMKKQFYEDIDRGFTRNVVDPILAAFNLKFVFPKKARDIENDGKIWSEVRDIYIASGNHYEGDDYLMNAAFIKSTFPSKYKELSIDPDYCESVASDLLEDENDIIDHIRIEAYMRVILAEEVKITTRGIEINFDKTPDEFAITRPIPERRRF